jgi:hypothetical protein
MNLKEQVRVKVRDQVRNRILQNIKRYNVY